MWDRKPGFKWWRQALQKIDKQTEQFHSKKHPKKCIFFSKLQRKE